MEKLVCSVCGTPTAPTPATFPGKVTMTVGGIDGKNAVRQVDGLAEAVTTVARPDRYAIMDCQACGQYFVARRADGGQWVGVYPISHKAVPKEIPEPIKSEIDEAQLCFAVGAFRACLSMCEAALEAVWRDQNAAGLNGLKEKGLISQNLFDQATEVRLWANVAKHEFVHQPLSREDAEELISYLEDILDEVYVKPARRAELRQKREQLGKSPKT
jgi:transcription elongation factor Elf1